MKRLALLLCLLPWLAFAQVGGGVGPVGGGTGPIAGCAGPVNGCVGPLGQVSQVYVLDQLSSYPAVAYSVRQLTAGQYLPAYDMTVRRSFDNATQNIGFSGGWLNTSALLTFCAATNCYVTTWKNQGSLGSSGDAAQTTAASQPQIVASGVLETWNGQPILIFANAGVSQISLAAPKFAALSSNFYALQVGFVGSLSSNFVYGTDQLTTAGGYQVAGLYSAPGLWTFNKSGASVQPTVSGSVANTLQINTVSYLASNSATAFVNGNAGTTVNSFSWTSGSSAYWVLGLYQSQTSTVNLNGGISEFIVGINQVLTSSNQAIIEISQGQAFNIPGVTQ